MIPRGACPTLADPMETGDGLLVRLAHPIGGYSPPVLGRLAAAAALHGNGLLDVSARGNVQVRGLTDGTIAAFRDAVERLAMDTADGPAIDVDPLAGLDPTMRAESAPLAGAIRARLAARPDRLIFAPKFAVVIDGGGILSLDALTADIRLVAMEGGWLMSLGGTAANATPLEIVCHNAAADRVVAVLDIIASNGPRTRSQSLLDSGGIAAFGPPTVPPAPLPPRTGASPIGHYACRDGSTALGIGLPFGQIDAARLSALATAADVAGARDIRPAPGRALLVTGLSDEDARILARKAKALSLITHPADPRLYIHACVGRPGCGSAHIATRALAPLVLPFAGPDRTVHLSGCAKGCAHPAASALTIVGGNAGCAIVRNGDTHARPDRILPEHDLPGWLAAHATESQ